MIDARTPKLLAEIEALPNAWDQALMMHAVCAAFPLPRIRDPWRERLEAIENGMRLTATERDELVSAATQVAASLKAWLGAGAASPAQ
jgi:hypothetical protein